MSAPVANVIIPPQLSRRPRDRRGYPIPYIVERDRKGKPQFTINNMRMVKRCLLHNRCGLCGEKMGEVIYFVGGPGCALHPNGAYVDPPMHEECVTYALKVCPFLAVRSYKGYMPTYVYEKVQPQLGRTIVEDVAQTMQGKPDLFIMRGTHGFVNMQDFDAPRLVPTDTVSLSYWKDGVELDEDNPIVDQLIKEALGGIDEMAGEAHTPQLRSPMGGAFVSYSGVR